MLMSFLTYKNFIWKKFAQKAKFFNLLFAEKTEDGFIGVKVC